MANTIGIDIGTTNIEYAYSSSENEQTKLYIERNPLSKYGLDVMTRITKANNGLLLEMSDLLIQCLSNKIKELLESNCEDACIKIAANTTMVHILMNYDCTNLGSFPFSPVHIEEIKTTADKINISNSPYPVTITPGLSAFVGGDIVSGLNTLPSDEDFLFIDLGTNAEMVLVKDHIAYITSAAAGPAFETCSYGHATDAVDGLFKMLETGIMDETGLLCDEFFENGYDCNNMHFSQKKIRDFQMAKAAIRSGIDLLLEEVTNFTKLSLSDIVTSDFKVYIAGNFGAKLNIINAIQLKMFPQWFLGRSKAIGNTSLLGTLSDHDDYWILNSKHKEIVLANNPSFNDNYLSNMNF